MIARDLEAAGWERIPATKTIKKWQRQAAEPQSQRHAASGQKATQKKEALADRLERLAGTLAGDLADKAKRKGANLQQTGTTLGIVIDKMQLLRGEATGIEERRGSEVSIYQQFNER